MANSTTTSRSLEAINNYARSRSKRALQIINNIMDDDEAPDAVRLKAAEAMLDRAVGKPTQKHEQTIDINIQQQHLLALKDAADIRLKAIDANKAKVHYVEKDDQLTIEHQSDPLKKKRHDLA